jgi:hypothetical protein
MNGLMHRSKLLHSIASSARARCIVDAQVDPSRRRPAERYCQQSTIPNSVHFRRNIVTGMHYFERG